MDFSLQPWYRLGYCSFCHGLSTATNPVIIAEAHEFSGYALLVTGLRRTGVGTVTPILLIGAFT